MKASTRNIKFKRSSLNTEKLTTHLENETFREFEKVFQRFWLALPLPSSQPLILASADRNKRPICGFVDSRRIYNFLPPLSKCISSFQTFKIFFTKSTRDAFSPAFSWLYEVLNVICVFALILNQIPALRTENGLGKGLQTEFFLQTRTWGILSAFSWEPPKKITLHQHIFVLKGIKVI